MTVGSALGGTIDITLQDLRYALTLFRRAPGFAFVAIFSIAVGAGANTAMFQLLDAVRLRTLPVRAPEELVELRVDDMTHARGSWLRDSALTNPLWEQIRTRHQTFSGMFAWADEPIEISSRGEFRKAAGLWVSGGFFHVLGIEPLLGRVFSEDDDRRGCGRDAGIVISYPFWHREFGGDPAIVGRPITLGKYRTDVIGVTPKTFFGLEVGRTFDVAMPICSEPAWHGSDDRLDSGTLWWLTVMGRLKPGVSLAQAAAAIQASSAGIFEATLPARYPEASVKPYLAMRLVTIPAARGLSRLRQQYSTALVVLLAITGFVLLIACANLAHLMLARTSARRRELAVRVAIGASQCRVARQLLTESLVLAAAGVAVGLLVARTVTGLLISFLGAGHAVVFLDVPLDTHTFAFTTCICVLACALFAGIPTLRAMRTPPALALKSNTRSGRATGESTALRRALLASQVAVSLALVMTTLLFTGSLRGLKAIDSGFHSNGVVIATVSFADTGVPAGRAAAFRREILDRVRSSSDVETAAEVAIVPLSGENWNNRVWMDGNDPAHARVTFRNMVGTSYFQTMGIPLLSGRDFTADDMKPSAARVAVVNEEFVRQIAPGARTIVGRRLWIEPTPFEPSAAYDIVGTVKDTKYLDVREPSQPLMFVPMSQTALQRMGEQLAIRSRTRAETLIPSMRDTFQAISPALRYSFRVFDAVIDESLLRERLMAMLSGPFAVLALVLTALGLYGVMSYVTAQRTHEIGIRIALGADRHAVVGLILAESIAVLIVGVAGGVALTVVAGRGLSALLYGVQPYDPRSLAIACAAIAAVALGATVLPARRAANIEPMTALRHE